MLSNTHARPRLHKLYQGYREDGTARVEVLHPSGETTSLRACHELRNHSPTGFEWGFCGSGPAQLSLALCLDATKNNTRALSVYQDFKNRVVSLLTKETWELSQVYVLEAIAMIEEERSKVSCPTS